MIKNLREFSLSRKFMTVEDGDKICHCLEPYKDMTHVYIYADQGYIYCNKDKTKFELDIDRSAYASTDVEKLEQLLWDWYKWETTPFIPYNDIEEDLHERSRDWLEEHHIVCSLDEVSVMYLDDLEPKSVVQYEYLTKQWNELSEFGDKRKATYEFRLCWEDEYHNIESYPIKDYKKGFERHKKAFDMVTVYKDVNGIQTAIADVDGLDGDSLNTLWKALTTNNMY